MACAGEEWVVARVATLLSERGWTLGTAESCTGGLVGHLITNLPGSSEFFLGGIVAYANAVKERVLGVSAELLRAHGAVSAEVAAAMAEGAKRVLGVDIALSVTGIAGPGGGTPGKPVGTVYIALAGPAGVSVRHFCWPEGRERNKELSAEAALQMLEEHLRS